MHGAAWSCSLHYAATEATMATATYEEAGDRGTSSSRRTGGSRSSSSFSGAASVLNTAALLDIVERLGVVDMVVDRIKGRLEEVDLDDLLDEAGDYLKRNPEVLVVSLGAITIAAGALVYLNKRSGGGSSTRRTSGSASSTSDGGSSSKSGGSKSKSRGSSSSR